MKEIARIHGRWFAWAISTVAWFGVAGVARADSQALLNDLLDSYINATPAEVFETQRRGGLTLGSVSVRSHILRPNFVSVIPPSIRGSCQGFDLVGGSFSFINGEQLQQYLRAIASNALNYAFTLALEGVCPTCMQKMEKLRDWSDNMNKNLLDSCHWATKLVDSGIDAWHRHEANQAQNDEVQSGQAEDSAEARKNYSTNIDADTRMNRQTTVNVVWDALQKSQTATWFGAFGDNDLSEIIMSVTGTMVKSAIDQSGAECQNTDSTREYCYRELMSLLDVDEFMNGSDSGTLRIYHCNDNYVQCVDPQIVERSWPGLNARIRGILFGPAPGYTGGLVYKLRDPTANYTDAEKRFIQAAPLPVYTLLQSSASSPGTLLSMGEQIQSLISMEVARNIVLEMIVAVKKSFSAHNVQMTEMMQQKLRDRTVEFQTRVSYDDRMFNARLGMLKALEQISQQNRGRQTPKATDTRVPRNKS